MRLPQVLFAVALAVTSLAACGQRKGFDQMDLRVEEVGEVPLDFVAKPPAHVGEITTWRTTFTGQEVMRVPADVEPKFVFVGACL